MRIGEFGESDGIGLAGYQGVEHGATAHIEHVAEDRCELDVRVLERLLDAQRVLADFADQLLPCPRQIAQFVDGRGWDEAAPNQSVCEQVGNPHGVVHVALAARYAADLQRVRQDELELPPGKVRVKVGGGVAGHNGLRSISSHIGNDYRRVRIGIGHPGIKELVHSYVLSDFFKEERPWVEAVCSLIADNAELLAKGRDAAFQNKVHLGMQAKGFAEPNAPDQASD